MGRGFHGLDLREEGSGNLGATNALRVLGIGWAVPVVVVDLAKGWLSVWLAFHFMGDQAVGWALAAGAAAILGHVFSFWVG